MDEFKNVCAGLMFLALGNDLQARDIALDEREMDRDDGEGWKA